MHYDEYADSGFFTVVRQNDGTDTKSAHSERLDARTLSGKIGGFKTVNFKMGAWTGGTG